MVRYEVLGIWGYIGSRWGWLCIHTKAPAPYDREAKRALGFRMPAAH